MAKKNKARGSDKIIALSDTHFGDKSQLLDDHSLVDRLMEVIESRGPVAELILLGDVLDLWMKTTVPAMQQARYFIDALSQLPNVAKVLYIPGNHDHQMFLDAFRLEVDVRIMQGDLSIPKFMPARSYGDTILSGLAHPKTKVHFPMVYPFITRQVNGRDIVFCHGHHLDFYAAGPGWGKFWLGRHILKQKQKKATLHDIEMANIPFCGAMSVWPWVPELVDEGLRFYHIINFVGRLFRSNDLLESPLRDSLIKENYEEIEQLLPQLGYPEPACFIYGHTHRPGLGKLPNSDTVVANTGCWTMQPNEETPTRTWVEIDGDVKLLTLGGDGPELLHSQVL
ncbi:MAG: metallophosphoesterase [Candidatus Geothermincolia bacterium]